MPTDPSRPQSDPRTPAPWPTDPWPTEIRLGADRRRLIVRFGDGAPHELSAEYLRVESPSAEVRGHSPAERRTVAGKRHVTISAVEPIGNYAVRLVFDDGHATGLYGWTFLAALIGEHDERWAQYLERLAAERLGREP